MRTKLTMIVAALGALALVAAGSPNDRATGGGQVLIGERGAGDTIAFTAQTTADGARGQVQYVDREDGTGQGQTTRHGTVTCLSVDGNMAVIGGVWSERDGGGDFELYVVDNGEGAMADNDLVTMNNEPTQPDCERDDDEDDQEDTALARGNAQVYDADGS